MLIRSFEREAANMLDSISHRSVLEAMFSFYVVPLEFELQLTGRLLLMEPCYIRHFGLKMLFFAL